MKLSEITKETLTDDDIQKIVYENVDDSGKIELLASIFNVEEDLIVCRIIAIMDKKANQKSGHNKGKKLKKIKMRTRKRKYKN